MLKKILLFMVLGSWEAGALAQAVYESIDEDGNPVFSDRVPEGGGMRRELPSINVVPSSEPAAPVTQSKNPEPADDKYQQLEIVTPQNNDLIRINISNVDIQVNLVPSVKSELGHRLQILWNGAVIAENQESYSLVDADLGSHTIMARVVNEQGKIMISTKPIIVYVRRHTN